MFRFSVALALMAGLLAPVALAQGGCGNCGGCAMGTGMTAANPLAKVAVANMAGKSETLSVYFGRWPVVMLIAGTDTSSKRAASVMQSARDKASKSDPSLVAVFKAKRATVSGLTSQLKLTYTTLADLPGRVQAALTVTQLPVLAAFNKAGKLLIVETTVTDSTMEAAMKSALEVEKLRDPVCGMTVTKAGAAGSSEYQGKTYYFCSTSCKQSFDKNPKQYLGD
jgi:YHS domain-containing protein